MASCVQYLHTLGANTVYVDAWHDGVAYFDSPTMRGLVGDDGVGADLVGWALAAARPLGMQVVAWLEYGLIAAPAGATSPFQGVAEQRGWISGTADGFQWLDAGNKAVLRFLCSLVADARRGYPQLQAAQLDDHFAAPVGLPGASVATMTAAARAISHNVSLTPGPPLTLAPATLDFALQQYNVDWAQWHQLGLFARFTPQIYRLTSAEFEAELTHTVTTLGSAVNLVAGIRASGSPETSWPQLAAMLSACEAAGVGQVVWDVRAVIGVYAAHFQQAWRPLPATVVSSA